jgi:hypothetical protein
MINGPRRRLELRPELAELMGQAGLEIHGRATSNRVGAGSC